MDCAIRRTLPADRAYMPPSFYSNSKAADIFHLRLSPALCLEVYQSATPRTGF